MLRLLKFLTLLLILLSSATLAQDKPAAPPKPTPEVQKLLDEGRTAEKKYERTTAVRNFEQARDKAQQMRDVAGEATALRDLGTVFDNLGQLQKGLEFNRLALPLFRQIGNKNAEANVIGNMGIIYGNLGQPQKALENLHAALLLYKQTGNRDGEADIHNNLGTLHSDLGQFPKALECYDVALRLKKELSDKFGEANTLGNIGTVYGRLGEIQKASEFYQQSLSLLRQTGDKNAEALTLSNVGLLYDNMGQPEKALEFYLQSLPLLKQMGDKVGEAMTLHNIGVAYFNLEQLPKALTFYQQALLLRRQTRDKNGEASTLTSIGSVYFNMGQMQKALTFYEQALPIMKQTENKIGQAYTLINVGSVYGTLGQLQRALATYRQALPFFQQIGDKSGEVRTLNYIGNIYIRLNDYRQAETFLRDALALQERIRVDIGGSAENRQVYLASVLSQYTDLLSVEMELKKYDRAFATVNKMKGRTLLDQSMRTQSLLTAIPTEAKGVLRKLWREVDRCSLALIAMEQRDEKAQKAAQARLTSAEQALQVEQDTLFARYPEVLAKQEAKTLTLADVPKFLPADTALLEYAVLKFESGKKKIDAHLLFVVTATKGKPVLTVHVLPVTQDKMKERAESLHDMCAAAKHYKDTAERLCADLLPPSVLKRIADKKRLVICPDGSIWEAPFAALLLPNGKHLIEQYELAYAYSAGGVQSALKAAKGKGQGMLAVANPAFGDETRFGMLEPTVIAASAQDKNKKDRQRPLSEPARGVFTQRGGIAPLPGTQLEADTIHNIYPDATILTNIEVQESELVRALPKYRYLHFATHGLLSDIAPLQSAIVLAVPPKGSDDDGFLTAREISELKLNAEMAVLSACDTGRGVNTKGEGVIGLTWALFAAGCPTQVVSQWKVSDNSTPLFMEKFYGNLKSGQGKGKALQNAAISMMKGGTHTHPYHWASFVLFGDWR